MSSDNLPETFVDDHGLEREKATGRYVKGVCGNPNGRPKGTSRDRFIEDLKKMLGDNYRELTLFIGEILAYDQQAAKDRWPKVTLRDKMRMFENLRAILGLDAPKEIKAEVEQKILTVSARLPDGVKVEDIE